MKSDPRTETQGRAGKRAQFSGGREQQAARKLLPKVVAGAVFVILLVGGIRMFSGDNDRSASISLSGAGEPAFQEVARGESISIALADVADGKAKFYSYKAADGRDVKFFVIKSSDGVYRAALDTCDVCYRAKKGYVQQGDQMVCRKCGQSFPSALVNEVSGGCNPVPLERTVEDGKLVIAASTLEGGKAYF